MYATPHLIFNCVFAQRIWQYFEQKCNKHVALDDVILGNNLGKVDNFIMSIVCYLIYKQWLLHSLQVEPRSLDNTIEVFRRDVKCKLMVYKHLNWDSVVKEMSLLVDE